MKRKNLSKVLMSALAVVVLVLSLFVVCACEVTPAKATLTSIEITAQPTKTTYTEGERFDKTGMVITAKYSDETTKTVTNYTVSPDGELAVTDKKIVVSYTENEVTKTAEVAIEVEKAAPTLTAIEVDASKAKTEYLVDETFTANGLKVVGKMSDGTTTDISVEDCTLSQPDMSTDGEKEITVTYQGKTSTYKINVAKVYNVSFNTDGGNEIKSVKTTGKSFEMPANPTKQGYEFDGWYYDYAATKPFDMEALATSPLTKDTVLWAHWNQASEVEYIFQAEDADCDGKVKIEFPESKYLSLTSGGRYVSCADMSNGNKFTFNLYSAKATQAVLKIVQNKPDDFKFEDKFALEVNGTSVVVGDVKGNGWGGNTWTNFGGSVDVDIALIQGNNTVVITIKDKSQKETNFDCIKVVTTDSVVRWAKGFEHVMEAENAILPEGAMIEDALVNGNAVASGKSVGGLGEAGKTIKFAFTSDDSANAVLAIDINRADPFTFEDVFTLKVNGQEVVVGAVAPGYWNGSTPYYCFGHLIYVNIQLQAGDNLIEFVSTGNGGSKTNFDRIVVYANSYIQTNN